MAEDPTGALAVRSRVAQNSKVIGAFAVGVLLTSLVVPQLDNDSNGPDRTGVAAGAPIDAGVATGAAAADPGGATVTAPGGATGAATGGAAPRAAAPGAAAAAAAGSGAQAARGQSGPGVTDKVITVGVIDLDSSDLTPVCPRCGNGPSASGAAHDALLAAWRRDGILPVNGRDVKIERRQTRVLDTGQRRAACVGMAQEVKPFLVIVNPMLTYDVAECTAKEFRQTTVASNALPETLLASAPTLYAPTGTFERTLRNFVHWAHSLGLFKNEVIGLYYHPNSLTSANQDVINRSLKPAMAQLGYKIAVEVLADGDPGAPSQTTPLAVQRFRSAGVTTALVIHDVLAFQQQADNQGWKPKYPVFDIGYTFVDAVADITFDPDQMDGNLGMRVKYWDWAKRNPATPKGNDTMAYCLKAYSDYSKRTLDVYENGAEIQYVIEACTNLEIVLKAIQNAGPYLSQDTLVQGLQAIRGLQTAELLSVTFGPNRRAGVDMQGTYLFKKARHPVTNEYFRIVTPGWQRMWVD